MLSVPSKFSSRFALAVACLMTMVVIYLHFTFLTHVGAFWRDEVNLINVASGQSIDEMTHDSCPILMPALVRTWASLVSFHDDFSLRIFGVIMGLGLVGALWWNSMNATREPPFWSMALLAMNGTVIMYGDSIRAYGLGSLAIVLAVIAAVFFLKKPSFKRTLLLATAAVVSVQSLYHNSVLVAAICFGLTMVSLRKKDWRATGQIFVAGLAAALSLVPYFPILFSGRKNCAPLYVGFKWSNLDTSLTHTLDFAIFLWIILSLALAFFFFQQWQKRGRGLPSPSDDLRLFAGATWLAAVIGYFAFLLNSGLPTEPWYLLPALALGATCFDLGVQVQTAGIRLLLMAYFLIVTVFAQIHGYQALRQRLTNIDDWSQELGRQTDRQDFIIVSPWFCGISFDHYYHGAPAWETIPPITNHRVHAYDLIKDELQQTNALQPILEQAETALKSGHRVWILTQKGGAITFFNPMTPVPDLPAAPFSTNGWSDIPYVINWTKQTAYFLRVHAQSIQQVTLHNNRDPAMFGTECMELSVTKGWRN